MSVNGTGIVNPGAEVHGTTERVALVVFHLLEGAELTTAEVADMAGVQWSGAEKMLDKASRVVPITKYESKWRRFEIS